jgi:hypothetical protein
MVLDEQRFAASVLARVTYDLDDATLRPSKEQPWIVSAAPWDGPSGPMDSDEVFYKGGVDLFVFGHARTERGRPQTQLKVVLEVGAFRREVLVFGDRVWQRQGKQLVPSSPQSFKAIPLTLAYAYGGKVEWDGLDIAFPDNPEGKGFYAQEAEAVDQPLPNLEEPDQLIRRWDDRPDPVGWAICAFPSGPRLRNGVVLDEEHTISKLRPQFFNAAFPRMIAERVQPGDTVRLEGVSENGPLAFSLPRHGFHVRLQFDDEVIERPLSIDQVGIEVEKRRVFVAYRYPFRYVLYPLQRRSCELFWDGAAVPGEPTKP